MNADTITAICAVVVAVASLAAAVWQGYVTRDHNRRSVRPLVRVGRWISKDKDLVSGIRMANGGLGPAFIVSTRLILDGQELPPWSDACAKVLQDRSGIRLRGAIFLDGGVLAAGEVTFLIGVRPGDVNRLARRLQIIVEYESLYGGEGFIEDSGLLEQPSQ
ncbi:hypothetical protein [Streptomyces sp. NPDC050504]|uniref:hypothetical protein n=1 Tax=Streptomyces sp. NPDC050504 TaxID=3365618 RepID=UPI003789A44C